MKLFRIALLSLFIFIAGTEARRLSLRPLSAGELRNALEESGIGSYSPAGKSVVSGLTGLSGLALGVVKGIGGSILFDVVTSNVTIEYLTSLLNSTSSSSTSSSSGSAQEICFDSRSVDGDIINGRSNDKHDDSVDPSGEWRQTATPTGSTTYGSSPTSTTDVTYTSTAGPTFSTPTTTSNAKTCIVLGSKLGIRRRRQVEIRPGTLSTRSYRLRKSIRHSKTPKE